MELGSRSHCTAGRRDVPSPPDPFCTLGLLRPLPSLEAPVRAAVIVPLAVFPLPYYVVSYVERYPMPLAWLLLLLAGFEVQSWMNGKRRRGAEVAGAAQPAPAAAPH